MSKNNENKLIPKLRFPEFINSNEWDEKPLGNISNRITEKNSDGEIKNVFTNSAVDGIVDQRDFFDKDIADKASLENYYVVKDGDYVYNPRISNIAPVGPISKNKTGKSGAMSPLYTVFRFVDKNNEFYEYYFKTRHWFNAIRKVSNTGARFDRMSITDSVFMSIPVLVPSPKEQKKIAACLSSLDEVITAESQKLDVLKDHKKGLLQNLLPQEGETFPKFRFKEFEDSGDWQETTLTQVASFVNNKTQLENLTINSYISTENLLPDYAGVALASKLPSSGNFTKYQKGDILVSNIRPYLKKVWFADKEGACSNDVLVIRATSSVSSEFLSNLLRNDTFIGYIMKNVEGVKMPRGDKDSIREYPIVFPKNPKEQEKIAETLSSVDDLIIAQNQKLEALQQHKKGLLQGLFPNVSPLSP